MYRMNQHRVIPEAVLSPRCVLLHRIGELRMADAMIEARQAKEGFQMRPLVDERITTKGKSQSEGPGIEVTEGYIELELPLDCTKALVVYLIPRSSMSVWVATCWDHTFDKIIEDPDEETLEVIAETWPTLAQLLVNGFKDLYSGGALIILEDLDDGENKWFVASVAGNISLEDLAKEFPKIQKVIDVVLSRSAELAQELSENKPSVLKAIEKGMVKGIRALLEDLATGSFTPMVR
jgi:hypothetical protein